MRCKKHCTDLSSIVGVCASCLRERLFSLIVAQEQAQAQALALHENRRNSDTNPAVPRVVSPYISRRQHDNSAAPVAAVQWPYNNRCLRHSLSDQRFYSTPQVTLNTGGCIGGTSRKGKKQSFIRFSSFSYLFRSNSRNGDTDSDHRVSVSTSREPGGASGNATSVTSSPSWFSNILPGGGRQKKKAFYVDESSTIAAAGVERKLQCRDRGMSPVRYFDDGGEGEFCDGSSGCESPESWKQTQRNAPAHHTIRRGGGGPRSVSGLAFCLSPLVRASPNRQWNQKGKPLADGGFSGDTRAPAMPHLSYAKSFCANRSRKLADFGRSNPNR